MFSVARAFPDLPSLKVVDVGSSPIDGDPPYKPLHDAGVAHVVGFEPARDQYQALLDLNLLRDAGYWLHRFLPLRSRVLKPMVVNNDIYAGMSQHLWGDAVFVKRFVDFPSLDVDALLKIALLAHDLYASYDLALLALKTVDELEGSNRQDTYLTQLSLSLA